MPVPIQGDSYTYERSFSNDEIREFGRISGDQQQIHTEPDNKGRLIAQGLLTATLFTKIAGELSFLARRTDIHYKKPVYAGETILCDWKNEEVHHQDDRYEMLCTVSCTDEDGSVVLTADIEGLVWK